MPKEKKCFLWFRYVILIVQQNCIITNRYHLLHSKFHSNSMNNKIVLTDYKHLHQQKQLPASFEMPIAKQTKNTLRVHCGSIYWTYWKRLKLTIKNIPIAAYACNGISPQYFLRSADIHTHTNTALPIDNKFKELSKSFGSSV